MSFGKQDGHLTKIGGYGATSSQQMGNATRRQSGPRKGSPSWANNYSPSEGTPDNIRIIPGNFDAERVDSATGQVFIEQVAWVEYTEHFHGGIKKGITCSGGVHRMGDWKKALPCRGCDISREDLAERRRIEAEKGVKVTQPNRVSFSSKYAFMVLDMGWFFKGYRLDEYGRPKVGQNGQAYLDWIKYTDQNYGVYNYTQQELARQSKAVEVQQGLIRSWPVGYTQFNTLIGYAELIQKHCRNCGGMNCIHTTAWVCPHCTAPTFMGGETTMPADKIKETVSQIMPCRACHQPGYPKAIQSCQHCSNPTPANLYDVDLQIQTIKVNNTKAFHLAGVSNPKPIDGVFAELLKKLPDMVKKFAPTPMEEQVALFGPAPAAKEVVQNQFQHPAQQQPAQHFGAPAGFGAPPPQGGYAPPSYQAPAFGNFGPPAQPQYQQPQQQYQPPQYPPAPQGQYYTPPQPQQWGAPQQQAPYQPPPQGQPQWPGYPQS